MKRVLNLIDDSGHLMDLRIDIDYNSSCYASRNFGNLILSTEAAKDLYDNIERELAWSQHPLYQWGQRKIKHAFINN